MTSWVKRQRKRERYTEIAKQQQSNMKCINKNFQFSIRSFKFCYHLPKHTCTPNMVKFWLQYFELHIFSDFCLPLGLKCFCSPFWSLCGEFKLMSYGLFPAKSHQWWILFVDCSHVFALILLIFNRNFLICHLRICVNIKICKRKIDLVYFLFQTVFKKTQNSRKSHAADLCGPGNFLKHTELDLWVKFVVN